MKNLFLLINWKRIIGNSLFLILFFTLPTLKAQTTYQPVFGNYNSNWNIYGENLDQGWTDSFYTAGDTIINSLQYKIVKPELSFEPTVYLRSDSSNSKLWGLTVSEFNTVEEHLIMDLSLGIGDSFYTVTPFGVVGKFPVDSVYLYEGRKHVRINTFYSQIREKLTFIEGVGANAGLYYGDTMPDLNLSPYVLCKHDSDSLAYSNTLFNGVCFIRGDGVKSIETKDEITLFPNPAPDVLNIKTGGLLINAIEVYSVIGEKLISEQLHSSKAENDINVRALPPGIYFVNTQMNNGNVEVRKFVKQ